MNEFDEFDWSGFDKNVDEFIEQEEVNAEKKRLQEIGKLGGRPAKKENKKRHKISLNLTEKQLKKLEEFAEKSNKTKQDYLRHLIETGQEPVIIETTELLKMLIGFKTNFSRIGNYFNNSLWTKQDKENVIKYVKFTSYELNKTLEHIRNVSQ